jgi:hypothetical protein
MNADNVDIDLFVRDENQTDGSDYIIRKTYCISWIRLGGIGRVSDHKSFFFVLESIQDDLDWSSLNHCDFFHKIKSD